MVKAQKKPDEVNLGIIILTTVSRVKNVLSISYLYTIYYLVSAVFDVNYIYIY